MLCRLFYERRKMHPYVFLFFKNQWMHFFFDWFINKIKLLIRNSLYFYYIKLAQLDILDQIACLHVPILVMDVGAWMENASALKSYVTQKPDVSMVRIHANQKYFHNNKYFYYNNRQIILFQFNFLGSFYYTWKSCYNVYFDMFKR